MARHPVLLALPILAATWAACTPDLPDHLSECPDDLCRQSWVSATARADALAAAREVAELRDPISAEALVVAVSSAHPDALGQVCEILSPDLGGARCEKARSRPHLWQVQARAPASAKGQRVEPHGQALPSLSPPESSLVDPGTLSSPRVVPCLAQTEPEPRAECLFQAAEAAADAPAPEATGEPTTLCLTASPFVSQCLLHILFRVGARAPVSTSDDAGAWKDLVTAVASSAAAIPDPELRRAWREQLWGNALRYAYEDAAPVTGHPLDHLPPEAIPHVHAALAWRLWALEGALPRDLAKWQARLSEALASREGPTATPSRQMSRTFRDLWPELLPGEEALPRVAYFTGATRTRSEDTATDALLALMEAAARADPPGTALLISGLSHASREVRWTAARLLGAHDPGRRLRRPAFEDADPLVAARARYRRVKTP